jgi:hypothetical protein
MRTLMLDPIFKIFLYSRTCGVLWHPSVYQTNDLLSVVASSHWTFGKFIAILYKYKAGSVVKGHGHLK